MNHTSIHEDQIVAVLRDKLPGLLAVYLFGSQALDMAGPDSDIDLAILADGRQDTLALWNIGQDLASMLDRDVDLLDLRAASTVMQYQIITAGRRLWKKDVQAGLFECAVLSQKTELDTARAGLLQDIQREGRVYAGK
jgi:predicted nucleotidyltransferase